jgi:hypothetical protein
MLRIPHCLDNRLTGSAEFVSLTRRPRFTTQEDSWYSILSEAESTPRPQSGLKELSIKKPVTSSGVETATFRLVA